MRASRRTAVSQAPRPHWARIATALTALFAILLHAFVVQPHVHEPRSAIAHAHVATSIAHSEVTATAFDAIEQGCIICDVLAAAGHAITPALATIALVANTNYQTHALAIRRAPIVLSHTWRSRAPPIAL